MNESNQIKADRPDPMIPHITEEELSFEKRQNVSEVLARMKQQNVDNYHCIIDIDGEQIKSN